MSRAARNYAERGIPVGPCKPWPEKSPRWKKGLLERGFNDYTTDLAKIDAFWEEFPDASIGTRLGEWRLRSEGGQIRVVRVVAVDVDVESKKGHGVDGFAGLKELEGRLGPLPRTWTNETPSDGEHRLFLLPEDVELTNLEGANALAPGVELKANGQVLAPPSPGYRVKVKAQVAELPRAWVDACVERSSSKKNRKDLRGEKGHAKAKTPVGERVPEGGRYFFLLSECGRLHDGTRDLARLVEDLDAINHERCDPPWARWEVEKQARWTYLKLQPCSPQKPEELLELVEVLEDYWFAAERKGLGARSEARFERLLIREGMRVGTVIPAGLRVEISFREVAEELGCHLNTVINMVKRLKRKGKLRQDNEGRTGPERGAFVLLDPRGGCDTPTNSSPLQREGCSSVTRTSRKGAAELETSHSRHLGPVGYSGEDALCLVEAYGSQTREELAVRLSWSRARDLERLHLRPLVERGLLDLHGDLYAIPGDYRERSASVRREPYSTVQLRAVRLRTPVGVVVVVVETGSVASEEGREHADRAEYAAQRAKFRKDWEANLIRAGDHARSERAETRAPHEERATSSHRTASAATRSPTTTERRTCTPGCRHVNDGHCCYHDDSPFRAKEVA
jgi:hypothetical protein